MLKINSFIYNVHYVQHVQIYCICEHPTYNCIALKKGGNIVVHTVLVFGNVQKRFVIMDQAYGFHYY